MEEHGGQISPIKEEGNPEHAAGPSSIKQDDDGEHEQDFCHLTSFKGSIFRIPGLFKMCKKQAYTPDKFSIGPWHVGDTRLLLAGQKLKESFLEGLITRFSNPEAKRRQLEKAIKNVHVKARECYEGGDVMDMAEEKFEKILLLDGCFIIELFRKYAEVVPRREEESVTFSGFMMQVIYHDLLLLENQIPWFVLDLLFQMTTDDLGGSVLTLVQLAIKFFALAVYRYEPLELFQPRGNSSIKHLVHLVWHFLFSSPQTDPNVRESEYRILIPSASRLKEAGVKFQRAASGCITDVRFNEGVLEMPPLLITASTETIFGNLIIFEQCSLDRQCCWPRVTCYAVLLDCLVNTSDDEDLMSRAGIFNNWSNPTETVNFFNRIRDNTPVLPFFYAELCKDVDSYCKRRWPRWRASLIQNYFIKPWAIVSVAFAGIVFFFTIMQVFYK